MPAAASSCSASATAVAASLAFSWPSSPLRKTVAVAPSISPAMASANSTSTSEKPASRSGQQDGTAGQSLHLDVAPRGAVAQDDAAAGRAAGGKERGARSALDLDRDTGGGEALARAVDA